MDTDRRDFLKKSAWAGTGLLLSSLLEPVSLWSRNTSEAVSTPAILGGRKAHPDPWPKWPRWKSPDADAKVLSVLRSGVWSRAKVVEEFEQQWAAMVGTRRCLSTVNGTNALIVSLAQSGIGIGDEVIVPPYTFVATVQAVLQVGAVPVFADVDRETFQIDPDCIEKKVTSRTKAILPVHILGMPADMPRILEIARKHGLLVIEDACQAHLAEVDSRRVGSLGDAGCFSFQNSKNIPIGEGGAIVSDDGTFMDRCYSYHNLGLPYGSQAGSLAGAFMVGTKVRFSEYQAAIGLEQLKDAEAEADLRWKNGRYLNDRFSGMEGVRPARLYPHTTKAVYHLYPLRYDKHAFEEMPRALFLKALSAEGVPCSSGYSCLHTQPFIQAAFESRLYRKAYAPQEIDYPAFLEANACPENDALCNEEAVWIYQNMLLAGRSDMDAIVTAVDKIRRNAGRILRSYQAGDIKL